MSRPGTRRQPNAPQWVYITSAVDLKQEILRRIEVYFEYEHNVSQTSTANYQIWLNGDISRGTPTKVCRYALDSLQLRSVKWTQGTQLHKRVMVLSPFNSVMEAPDTNRESSNVNLNSSQRNDEINDVDLEETTNEKVSPDEQSVEQIHTDEESRMLISKNDEKLNTMITDAVNTYMVTFRDQLVQEMKDMMKQMMADLVTSTVETQVLQVITEKGNTEIDKMLETTKPKMVEKVQSMLHEVQNKSEKDLLSKEQIIIKNFAVKRDEILEAINVEADQAIEDFLGATEQERKQVYKDTDTKMETDDIPFDDPQTHPRFRNVNPNDLKVDENAQYGYTKTNTKNYNAKDHNGSSMSTYGFHKYFKAKLKNDTSVLNFYQQLHKQGSPYGIHCIPLQDIHINVDLCPRHFDKRQRDDMALTIYQKLQDEDCVSVGYTKAQRIIQQYAGISDGYRVLEQLLRFVHPNLKHSTSNTYDVPKLSQSFGNLYDYGSKIMNYILMQNIQHRTYTVVEQTVMFLNNMDEEKYNEAKNRALVEVRQTGSRDIDPNLTLDSLPTTLEQYHEQLHGSKHIQQSPRYVRSMYDIDKAVNMCEDISHDEEPIIRTFVKRRDKSYNSPSGRNSRDYRQDRTSFNKGSYSNRQCKACGRWGCTERKCQFVAKVHLAITYIKENGNAAHKLAQEYLRTNNSRTRMSMIRTLHATGDRDIQLETASDHELLEQYHLEIPMEEIDFDSNDEE